MSNAKTEAQRLADAIDPGNEGSKIILTIDVAYAAAELRRLDAEEKGLTDCVIRQGELLRNVVIAVRGLPPENMGWSSHDAPELVRALVAERDQLRAQLAKAVAEEREACAKVCERIDIQYEGEDVQATWCAAAIRARSNT